MFIFFSRLKMESEVTEENDLVEIKRKIVATDKLLKYIVSSILETFKVVCMHKFYYINLEQHVMLIFKNIFCFIYDRTTHLLY